MDIDQSLNLKRDNWLDTASIAVTTVLFALLIVLVSAQVLIRVFSLPITATWTEPISRFLFIVGTYFGAAIASRNDEHVRLTLVREKLLAGNEKAKQALDVITGVIVVAFLLIALFASYRATINGWQTKALGGAVSLTAGHIYLGITLGFCLLSIFEIQNVVASLRNVAGSSTVGGETPSPRGDS